VVEPTVEDDNGTAAAFLRRKPRVRYVSSDAADGRLISPCKCKGSQKYVHEGCLWAWRQSRPLSERNFWRCPTCGFEYKMERLRWGRWISSRATRAALTLLVFVFTIFLLGFLGDPILNILADPVGMLADTVIDRFDDLEPLPEFHFDNEQPGWLDHFLKGFLSLGLLGFLKTLFAMSPFYWWNLRTGLGGRGRRRGGRDRLENINLAFIIVGAFTFLSLVWKGISYLSGLLLEKATQRVVDVHGDVDEDDQEAAGGPGEAPETRKDQ